MGGGKSTPMPAAPVVQPPQMYAGGAPPDYNALLRMNQENNNMYMDMSRRSEEQHRREYEDEMSLNRDVVQDLLKRQDEYDAMAKDDRKRYQEQFQPIEDQLTEEVRTRSVPGYAAQRAEVAGGRAAADVSNQFEMARAAAQDRLESFGIDPSQVRSGALDVSTRIAEAAARAGAINVTRENVRTNEENITRAMRTEALNIGRGYPGQYLATQTMANQSGVGGTTAFAQPGQAVNANAGSPIQWAGAQGTAMQGMGNAMNMWGNYNTTNLANFNNANSQNYATAMKGWATQAEIDSKASSGFGGILGNIAGMAFSKFFEEGGPVEGVPIAHAGPGHIAPPVEGVPVTPAMSPSRGVAVDDVPVAIRGPTGETVGQGAINVGEFVVPEDVVKWKGEEFFQKTIENSRRKRQEAPARPRMGVPVGPTRGAPPAARQPTPQALPLR